MYKYVYKVQLYVEWERPTKPYVKGMAPSNQTCYVISDKKYDGRYNDDLVKECKETLERTILSFVGIKDVSVIDVNCTECNMHFNEYLPEKFYLLLQHLREALHIYHNEEDSQNISDILEKFKGKLPDKIEEHIFEFNDLNRALKDIKRNPTYDRPKYFYSGLYEEIFLLDKMISEETIEINNEISKKTDININNEKFAENQYTIEEYEIKEESYQNVAKKNGNKISIGNIAQYQTVKRGEDELFLSNTFSVVEYDPKNLTKNGIDAVQGKFIEKTSKNIFGNLIKSLNLTLMSNVNTTFKDKNGNILEAELKLFGCNFLCGMQINKINGQEVTKIPKELTDIVEKYNKPLSGVKYYFNNKLKIKDRDVGQVVSVSFIESSRLV